MRRPSTEGGGDPAADVGEAADSGLVGALRSSGPPGSVGWTAAIATALAGRPGGLLVVADFDGTLAEASRDPGAAAIVPLSRRALRRLAGVAAVDPGRVTVAVLTGRTAADVAARVAVGGILYLGDHGLQRGTYPRGSRPGSIHTTFRAGHDDSFAPAEQLAARVPAILGNPPWLFVERKGPSVAFHVRQAEDPLAARATVQAAIAQAERDLPPHDLAHYRGRMVVDLRPRHAGGKREAMGALLAELHPSTVVAFGDDSSDADAFAVLAAARDAGICDGLAVGVTGPRGVPDDVRAHADVVLETPRQAARLLAALARALAATAVAAAAPNADADPDPGADAEPDPDPVADADADAHPEER